MLEDGHTFGVLIREWIGPPGHRDLPRVSGSFGNTEPVNLVQLDRIFDFRDAESEHFRPRRLPRIRPGVAGIDDLRVIKFALESDRHSQAIQPKSPDQVDVADGTVGGMLEERDAGVNICEEMVPGAHRWAEADRREPTFRV
jgi:hypothetical protein